jgi:hypothetical protein
MRKLSSAVAIVALALPASALATTWHGTNADSRALSKAIEAYPNFGCYRPVGHESLVNIRISNSQREQGINYVAVAFQRPPKNAQGCEIIFEHHKGGGWNVLSYGTSPCEGSGSRHLRAACRAFRGLSGI